MTQDEVKKLLAENSAAELKLAVGDVFLVHGWLMLRGLDDGRHYKVVASDSASYSLRICTKNGVLSHGLVDRRCRHYANLLNGFLHNGNVNYIERI